MGLDYPGLLADLRHESDRLIEQLNGLAYEQWGLATPAQGWSIQDQISHLAFFDDTARLALTEPDQFRAVADEAAAYGDATWAFAALFHATRVGEGEYEYPNKERWKFGGSAFVRTAMGARASGGSTAAYEDAVNREWRQQDQLAAAALEACPLRRRCRHDGTAAQVVTRTSCHARTSGWYATKADGAVIASQGFALRWTGSLRRLRRY